MFWFHSVSQVVHQYSIQLQPHLCHRLRYEPRKLKRHKIWIKMKRLQFKPLPPLVSCNPLMCNLARPGLLLHHRSIRDETFTIFGPATFFWFILYVFLCIHSMSYFTFYEFTHVFFRYFVYHLITVFSQFFLQNIWSEKYLFCLLICSSTAATKSIQTLTI